MKKFFFLLAILLISSSCAKSKQDDVSDIKKKSVNSMTKNKAKDSGMYAIIETNYGSITCQLFYKKVPVTVANFVGLAEGTRTYTNQAGKKVTQPFFNDLTFHRIIDGFVIQGGCPLGNGTGDPGYSFPDEFDEDLTHNKTGLLSMANSGKDTNGSQFFITLAPTPHLDFKHSVFGQVVEGMDIVNQIARVSVDNQGMPDEKVMIKTVKIDRVGEESKAFDAEKEFLKRDELTARMKEFYQRKITKFHDEIGYDESKIKKTGSGLEYIVKKKGDRKKPQKGNTIVAHYAGYFTDGTKFDSSFDRNQPFETPVGVGRVIKGWDEAFLDMNIGERRILIIPYNLAYGEQGYSIIPPKATLIFDVELLEIKK